MAVGFRTMGPSQNHSGHLLAMEVPGDARRLQRLEKLRLLAEGPDEKNVF